jgi:hypothetical protein
MYLASNQTLNSIKLWLAETYPYESQTATWMSYANGTKLNLEERESYFEAGTARWTRQQQYKCIGIPSCDTGWAQQDRAAE